MSSGQLLTFVIMSVVLVVVPGPSVLFAVSRALVLGRRGALATVVGNAFGVYAQVVAVAFGLGAVVERSVVVFTVVKFVGAGYLMYLGVQAIRHRRSLADAVTVSVQPAGTLRAAREGFVVGLTNPKAIVFFAAVLPQFVDRAGFSPAAQMLVLGLMFMTIAVICDGAWAVGAGAARSWFTRSPRRLAQLGGIGGVAMVGIGAQLAVSGRHD
ncbi:threonine/homoserine/homoserine lactone efflux protein [Haloactinopolyspora alba]|uniref:Threonine/homoserine/homoserine lactone efflux protein n=1 Tax=Haloactinopolyspora alba TaxID=648780 RepID=A0A2P8E997_9ACTN|nr:threonine/homoserine/homoserine lactone efflux protein [Haloactinopolyspora alba]